MACGARSVGGVGPRGAGGLSCPPGRGLLLLLAGTYLCLVTTLPGVSANDRHTTTNKDKRGDNVTMTSIVNAILRSETYDSHIRPGVDSGDPTIVYLNIFVNSISSIDDFNMEYAMTFYLRQRWQDPRLSYKGLNKTVTLNYNDIHRIWVPDLFFRNEKAGMLHDITVPNRLLRLWPDGSVLYSQRISLRLDCMMQLQKYPLDDQKCRMEIGSYGYTTNDLVFKWLETGAPLSMKENLELPEFGITGTKVGDCTRVFSTGTFACVYAEFHFDRKFEFYLLQTYIPSFLIVVLSWVSFWIDINAVPARISLGLLTVLTMTTQSSAISARLPRVSYIKAIDVWMAVCLVFVFSALIEYSAVNVLYRKTKSKDKHRHRLEDCPQQARRQNLDEGKVEGADAPLRANTIALCHHCGVQGEYNDRKFQSNITFCQKSNRNQAIIVDTTSRFLFPTSFMVFNFVYWLLYASIL